MSRLELIASAAYRRRYGACLRKGYPRFSRRAVTHQQPALGLRPSQAGAPAGYEVPRGVPGRVCIRLSIAFATRLDLANVCDQEWAPGWRPRVEETRSQMKDATQGLEAELSGVELPWRR